MRRLFVLLCCIAPLSAAAADPPDTMTVAADTSLVFEVEVGSRLYPDWSEDHRVALGKTFFLGDTPFVARLEQFFPDFKMQDGKPVNFSTALENPAAQVVVYQDSVAVDTTWAFLNFPPHFSADSFFSFRLKTLAGYQESDSDPESKEK